MSKKCEIKGIKMMLKFLEIPSLQVMMKDLSSIKAWRELFESGWEEEDLIQRAWAHLKWTEREAEKCNQSHWVGNAKAFLSSMAKGFLNPFDRQNFMPQKGDLNFAFKVSVLDAIQDASNFYGNRCSSVLWDSFAYLGTRENPEVSRSILKEAEELPHHYGIVDTMLHASAKCYKLLLTVQFSVDFFIFNHSNNFFIHVFLSWMSLGFVSVFFRFLFALMQEKVNYYHSLNNNGEHRH